MNDIKSFINYFQLSGLMEKFNSKKEVLDSVVKRLSKDKNVLSVFLQGSSVYSELDDYADIDLNILYNKKPKKNLYLKPIKINGKNILISFSYRKYDENLNPLQYSVEEIATNLISLENTEVLYDRGEYYKKFEKTFKKSHLRKKQKETFPFYFRVLVDTYYKTQRSYKRKHPHKLRLCGRSIGDKSLKLINYFNNIISNKNLYSNPKDLKKKPRNYDKYFYYVRGLENPQNMDELYYGCIKLIKNTVFFIKRQDLSEIKDKGFHELLDEIAKELKR